MVTPDDLVEFGMIPEFIGRLPIIAALRPLPVEALVRVLTEPRNALVRQYQKQFELEGAKLTFTEGALRALAEKAAKRETGARALRAVMEETMLELMYDLPDMDADGVEFVVDEATIRESKKLSEIRVKRAETA